MALKKMLLIASGIVVCASFSIFAQNGKDCAVWLCTGLLRLCRNVWSGALRMQEIEKRINKIVFVDALCGV
ncbi:MAG: hypothetical protein NC388_10300 [Clostridium sp.]|nr:hypothetical protein [Clostridium sp.]